MKENKSESWRDRICDICGRKNTEKCNPCATIILFESELARARAEGVAEGRSVGPSPIKMLLEAEKSIHEQYRPLIPAAKAMIENIEWWLRTGKSNTPEKSKKLYEDLKSALDKIKGE